MCAKARAANTRRAYDQAWRAFESWCAQQRLVALPATPDVLALYLTHLTELGRRPSTIRRARDGAGPLAFQRAPAPSQRDVERLALDIQARVLRLLEKRGLLQVENDDPLAQDSPALAACYEGAVTQRVGLGPTRGRPVIKLDVPLTKYLAGARKRVQPGGMLCANVDGFDLHGRIAFGAAQRERLEELVRYCARPPLANDRLERRGGGRYVLRLKTRWRDGTAHLVFEPIELMERLAAQIPKPRINLVLYAGVLAPHSKWRAQAVCYARPMPLPDGPATETQTRAERETWAELMRLTFGLCRHRS